MVSIEFDSDILKDDFFSKAKSQKYEVKEGLMDEFFGDVKEQVSTNIIQNFGIGPLLEKIAPATGFQDGGNVDTIRNVENGMELKSKAARERFEKQKNYKYSEYHDKNPNYAKTRKQQQSELRKGKAIDQATGKPFRKNQKGNLDHVVSAKEISQDASIALANIDAPEIANRDYNLKFSNEGYNKSKGEKSVSEYIAGNKQRKANDKERFRKLDKNDPSYENKVNNIQGRSDVSEERISESDRQSRQNMEKEKNKKYYNGNEFKKNVAKTSLIQGGTMALKQVSGLVVYEFTPIFFGEMKTYLKNWKELQGRRFAEFKKMILRIKEKFLQSFNKIKGKLLGAASSGFASGVFANICTVVTNIFKKTSSNIARLINDGIGGVISGIKMLTTNPQHLNKSELIKAVIKTITVALAASVGVIASEAISAFLVTHGIHQTIADLLASTISAIMTGIVSALLIYAVDNFDQILKKVANLMDDIKFGLLVSKREIEQHYQELISKVDNAYKTILSSIEEEYARIGRLADLAHDMNQLASGQLSSSVDYARISGVQEKKILHNNAEVSNYFLGGK